MKKGLTLIEVVISLAILGMISIILLPIFTTGLNNVVHAGDRTEEVYNIESTINSILNGNILVGGEVTIINDIKVSAEDDSVFLNFGEGLFTKTVNGSIIDLKISEENMNLNFKTFIPK